MTDNGPADIGKDGRFTCDECGGTFPKAWSDEEAEQEYDEVFTSAKAANISRAVVCDDCYNQIMGIAVK